MRRNFIICLLLAGLTLAVYWPVGGYDYVRYDDPLFFVEVPEVQSGLNWHSFTWAMSSVVVANWHPVTSLSFVLTHQLFGTNAHAEHWVNVMFHAANAVLLFLVLGRMTRLRPDASAREDARPTEDTLWRCALVAAVFALHPLRVESVAWIAERKDVLCGFFMLLTLWAWTRYVEKAGSNKPAERTFNIQHSTFNVQQRMVVLAGPGIFRAGVDEQGDGGDAAVFDVVAGCVAVEAGCEWLVES